MGKYYLFYNHFDSYPSYLGKNLVDEIKRRKFRVVEKYVGSNG